MNTKEEAMLEFIQKCDTEIFEKLVKNNLTRGFLKINNNGTLKDKFRFTLNSLTGDENFDSPYLVYFPATIKKDNTELLENIIGSFRKIMKAETPTNEEQERISIFFKDLPSTVEIEEYYQLIDKEWVLLDIFQPERQKMAEHFVLLKFKEDRSKFLSQLNKLPITSLGFLKKKTTGINLTGIDENPLLDIKAADHSGITKQLCANICHGESGQQLTNLLTELYLKSPELERVLKTEGSLFTDLLKEMFHSVDLKGIIGAQIEQKNGSLAGLKTTRIAGLGGKYIHLFPVDTNRSTECMRMVADSLVDFLDEIAGVLGIESNAKTEGAKKKGRVNSVLGHNFYGRTKLGFYGNENQINSTSTPGSSGGDYVMQFKLPLYNSARLKQVPAALPYPVKARVLKSDGVKDFTKRLVESYLKKNASLVSNGIKAEGAVYALDDFTVMLHSEVKREWQKLSKSLGVASSLEQDDSFRKAMGKINLQFISRFLEDLA